MEGRVDPTLMPGAQNAMSVCLNVAPHDRVWILTDEDRNEIGRALAQAAREQGASVTLRRMEEFGPRPFHAFPDAMRDELRALDPTVTLLATSAEPGEIRFRLPFARFLRQELQVRHGHMIGVTRDLMQSGMRANYQRVADLTFLIRERMQQAREVRVTSELGGDLRVQLDNERFHWMPFPGLLHQPGQWGNLPEGETCTTPVSVQGTFYASLLGDYFSRKYGVLRSPILFHIQDGWVTEIVHEERALADEVWSYLDGSVNGRRVGEFAVGTNEALHALSGNLLQDEKFPGVHLAFGNPVPETAGATWSSDIHVDAIAPHGTIYVDGEPLMRDGKFLL